jgi:hypothetical protein
MSLKDAVVRIGLRYLTDIAWEVTMSAVKAGARAAAPA